MNNESANWKVCVRRSPRIDLTSLEKSFFIQCKNAFDLHSEYHTCCWPGDERHQGICSHGIKLHMLLSRNIPVATMCNTLSTFDTLIHSKCVNSLGIVPSYGETDMGRHRLAQVMACCLTTPSHYPKECWLIINVLCGIHLRAILQDVFINSIRKMCWEIAVLKLSAHLEGVNVLIQRPSVD